MNKKVNVYATVPVHGAFTIPLVGTVLGLEATTSQIYRCLISGALVQEVLPNREVIKLNFSNYDKENYKFDLKNEASKIDKNCSPKTEPNKEENLYANVSGNNQKFLSKKEKLKLEYEKNKQQKLMKEKEQSNIKQEVENATE